MRLFLSYGHQPAEIAAFAHRLKADLEAAGHGPWIDSEGIARGHDWRERLIQALHETDWTVGLLSRHAMRDGGVTRQELAIADGVKGGCLTTILVEPLDGWSVPPTIGRGQWIDMSDWQQRQAADPAAYDNWYREKLGELLTSLDPAHAGRHAAAMEAIAAQLRVKDHEAYRKNLTADFVGRGWLVDRIDAWRLKQTRSRLFWLQGGPGSGKSAAAAWIAATHQCSVVALNLCDWMTPGRADPREVIAAIAWQVARRVADYRYLLAERLLPILARPDANGIREIDRLEPPDLFDRLLIQPLHHCFDGGQTSERLLIVIDGLDEAEAALRRAPPMAGPPPHGLIDLLRHFAQHLPEWVGVLVTSRPEEPMTTALAGSTRLRLEAQNSNNEDDLRLYLRTWLGDGSRPADEVERLVRAILAKAAGNFMYVRKLREFHDNWPEAPLDPGRLPEGLGGLYHEWMGRQFPDRSRYRAEIAPMLEIMAAAENPVPEPHLRAMLNIGKVALKQRLESLGGLIEPRGAGFAPFHKSLQDWLCERAPGDFLLEVETGEERLRDWTWAEWLAGPEATEDLFLLAELPVQVARETSAAPKKLRRRIDSAGAALDLSDRIDATASVALGRRDRATAFGWWDMAACLGAVGGEAWQPALRYFAVERGDAEQIIGSTQHALAAYRTSMAIAERLVESDPGLAEWQRELSVSHHRIGDVLMAAGDRDGALAAYRNAMAISEWLADSDPGNARWQRDLSVSHSMIGDVLRTAGDRDGALAAYRAGMAIAERLAESDPGHAEWQSDLSVTHIRIGDVLSTAGDRDGALAAYRNAMAIRERLAESDPGHAEWQRDPSVSHNRIGDVLMTAGNRDGALAAYRAGMAIAERLVERDPGNAEWQRDLSVSHSKIGDVLRTAGDRDGALAAYREGMAIAERLAESDPGNAEWQRDLSVSHGRIGDVLRTAGDHDGALAAYRAAMTIRERLVERDPGHALWQRDLSVSHNKIGDVLMAAGDRDGALTAYRAAMTIRERLVERDPGNAEWQRDLSVSHSKIGDVLMAAGDRDGALAAYRAGMTIREGLAASDPGNAEWQRDLFVSHAKLGDVFLSDTPAPDAAQSHVTAAMALARARRARFPDWPEAEEDLEFAEALQRRLDALSAGGAP